MFAYDPAIVERYPSVVGGVLVATGVTNGPSDPALVAAFEAEQAAAIARIGDTPLSEIPSLAAWRRAFRAFGVDPTAYRSASEALLRRLTKQGSIPSINTLVDIGNLVSIRHALPVAMFDLASVSGGLTVTFATGDESFTDLGSGSVETPSPARSSSSTRRACRCSPLVLASVGGERELGLDHARARDGRSAPRYGPRRRAGGAGGSRDAGADVCSPNERGVVVDASLRL